MEWVNENLIEGKDFGKIHTMPKSKCQAGRNCTNPYHFSKPFLHKPGSEKILNALKMTPTFPTLQDYERLAIDGHKIKDLFLRCEIVDAYGNIHAVGAGGRDVMNDDKGNLNKAIR